MMFQLRGYIAGVATTQLVLVTGAARERYLY